MKTLQKLVAACAFGTAALGVGVTASAADRDRYEDDDRYGARPQHCGVDHDHRSHDPRYYDYYPGDRYSVGVYIEGGRGREDDYGRGRGGREDDYGRGRDRDDDWRGRDRDDDYGRGRDDDRYGYGYDRPRSRVIRRATFDTRYRARIHLVEELFETRNGRRLVCTLDVRGPDARYVHHGQLRRIASRECSRRAEIRIR